MEILTWTEFARRLGVKEETFRRLNWRVYRHIFVGKSRNLRSARFAWHDDGSHLCWEGGAHDPPGRNTATGRIEQRKGPNPTIDPEFDVFRRIRKPDGSIPPSPLAK